MKKILLFFIPLLLAIPTFAQSDAEKAKQEAVKPVNSNSEMKALVAEKDTAKAHLRAKNSEYNKDNNRLTKLLTEKEKLKTQLKSAKQSKKTLKVDEIQSKITENDAAIKSLEAQLKVE